MPGSLHGAGALLPHCDSEDGWGGQRLCLLVAQGIFPMWAVPVRGVPKHIHSLSPKLQCQLLGTPKCYARS